MTACDARRFPSEIDRLFAGRLTRRRLRALRDHLAGCGGCRGYYTKISALQRRLSPDEPLAAGLLEANLLERLDEQAPRRRWPWLSLAAAGALSLAVVTIAKLPARHAEFQERGGATQGRGEGARAFCLAQRDDGSPSVVDSAPFERPPAASRLSCSARDTLQFACSADSTAARFLFLVGIDAAGAPHFYNETGSVALRAGAREVPLDGAIRLAARHPTGATRLLALFSSAPLTREQVAEAIARGGLDAAAALADDPQSLALEVTP